MLRLRQSSPGWASRMNCRMSPKTSVCMQAEPNLSAARTPDHGLVGCGDFQRRSPMGGAAKGIPLKMRTERSALVVPRRKPDSTLTFSWAKVAAEAVRRIRAVAAALRNEACDMVFPVGTRTCGRGFAYKFAQNRRTV